MEQVLILLDGSYASRFWTLMEAWSAMKAPSADGVRTARGGEERYKITCIHNADAQLTRQELIQRLSEKTPEQMHAILAKPDINITNTGDKDKLLVAKRFYSDTAHDRGAKNGEFPDQPPPKMVRSP